MKRYAILPLLAVLLCAGVRAADAPKALSLPEALKKAEVQGRYAMLLRQLRAPEDAAQYGEFKDYGYSVRTEWAGQKDLPPGYWVYVYPRWYLWRDRTDMPLPKRAWGPEQATGEPDTFQFGDIQTAWASKAQDDRDEWVLVEYAEPVQPNAVRIHETYNPGAVSKVTAFKLDGEEVTVWQGRDPVNGLGVAEFALEVEFKTNRIKLYLDSQKVAGWNEIDAVGLQDADGRVQWARAAEASTTYAADREKPDMNTLLLRRIAELEDEVQRLRKENEALKKPQ